MCSHTACTIKRYPLDRGAGHPVIELNRGPGAGVAPPRGGGRLVARVVIAAPERGPGRCSCSWRRASIGSETVALFPLSEVCDTLRE